jgi:dihydropteroate synthase
VHNTPFQIVGILNVTPDSYFDGGKWNSVERAVARTGDMLREGADWVEVGGESTGPHSHAVSIDEELQRTIPVIQAIQKRFPEAKIGIDTYKAEIARQAIAAGAAMVNDVTAGRGDRHMFSVLSTASIPIPSPIPSPSPNLSPLLVLMYAKDPTPRTTVAQQQYDDVIETILSFLRERRDAALMAGISRENIILDPGLGHFVSGDARYSYEIIARLSEFAALGAPILVSPSRKSFLLGPENLSAAARLPGTIAASAIAVLYGARYIRTHDIADVRRGCEIAQEILSASRG